MLDNIYTESIEESGNYLRMVLKHIARYKLPYNPISYALWYEYTTGHNEKLFHKINKLEDKKIDITYEIVVNLFRHYLADSHVTLAEKKTNEFQGILAEITKYLLESGDTLDHRGNTIEQHISELNNTDSIEDVSTIAKKIVQETKSIVESSHKLNEKFNDASTEINTLLKELSDIKQIAKIDMLTGLLNRRGFDEAMSEAMEDAKSSNHALSTVLLDIDHFKKVNDTHGHLIGDNVLKVLGRFLKEHIKGQDTAARYGGEEFILVLPNTNLKGAYTLAENIRKDLMKVKWTTKNSKKSIGTITISLGVAQYKKSETMESLIERTDKALYFAKEHGRNQTITETDLAKTD